MRTLGIDLASQPRKTGACVLEWTDGGVRLASLQLGADDERLLELAGDCDAIGIDAPFGWPVPFAHFVAEQAVPGGAERPAAAWCDDRRDELRYRATDQRIRVAMGRPALSVSSDLIAVPAWRCLGLLERLGVIDRSGDGRVFEVYPASALNAWGLRSRRYKGSERLEELAGLADDLISALPALEVDDRARAEMAAHDDALDAVVSALVARAAALGLTERPPSEDLERARVEGWIHLPRCGLDELLG